MNLLSETPWWLPTLLVLAGVALHFTLKSHENPRARLAPLLLILLGLALALTSYLLESDREAVERRTREVVSAVASGDINRMTPYLDPEITIGPLKGRDAVAQAAHAAVQTFSVESASVTGSQVTVLRDEATADIQVGASTKSYPYVGRWRLRWVKDGKTWLLLDAEQTEGPAAGNLTGLQRLLK